MSDQLKAGDLVRVKQRVDLRFSGCFGTVKEQLGDNFLITMNHGSKPERMFPRAELEAVDPVAPYSDALFAVDPGACNLSGLVKSLARHIDLIWDEAHRAGKGTDYVNTHPAVVLFVCQMMHLCRADSSAAFANAYEDCKAKVAAGKAVAGG